MYSNVLASIVDTSIAIDIKFYHFVLRLKHLFSLEEQESESGNASCKIELTMNFIMNWFAKKVSLLFDLVPVQGST